ncbi:tetratricopeptide repeat protein [Bradyrhizobium sp. LHD-71]|uniref:tetratricopeptide repeat protein n=1 Tax=Bradyrhizobium sp. LHD-71 TaxID=3072141 RepID=UPI0028104C9E|nr:tetratricopeptide repeat protein [Bradyrhizobium sp. LHD-71]MDQ8728806.1 tetratricopeptide repeat protein [Bradyrhizobium sp. LHD-71]
MRISRHIASSVMAGAALAASSALAFEGTTPGGRPAAALSAPAAGLAGSNAAIPVPPMSVAAGASAGAVGKNAAPPANSLSALQYAAEGGHPIAQWRLGRMYASGDGVDRDDLRAFDYFSRIANQHAEDSPSAPQAQIVANAFVALGRYYRDGIPNTRVKSDRERAREMFHYAATYFGNADAQYNLARMYLDGVGSPRDPIYAARWLSQAAQKGQYQAQALLGQMLFNGDVLQRQAARGLMWLTLARENAGPDELWINEVYTSALKRATEDDRAMAGRLLERWVQGRRD